MAAHSSPIDRAFALPETLSLLARTPAVLNALLRDLPEVWTHRDEGTGTWSPAKVLEHLIHAEYIDWMPRVRMILEVGETQIFAPFQRQPASEEHRSLPLLLDEFAQVRSENLTTLNALHLTGKELVLRGQHPAFGPVTLAQLLATWAAHDLTHLHQLSRVMAHQYRDAVGPWKAYLGVLHCSGHSS